MLAAGIRASGSMEELESHLRDEIREQMRTGLTEETAFEISVQKMGEAGVLKNEFAKVGETVLEQLKRLFCAFAGIPDYQLAMNMNAPNQNLEPGWATYLKSAALIVPAVLFWVGSCAFLVPKLRELCVAAGTVFPKPILLALSVSDMIRINFLYGTLAVVTALVLLEWRWRKWPRYRRLVFGVTAFSLNFIALALLAILLFCAVLAGATLVSAK